MATRNVALPDPLEQDVNELVKTGHYQNRSEVIWTGLRLLLQQEAQNNAKLEAFHNATSGGLMQLERGEYDEITSDNLAQYLDELGDQASHRSTAKYHISHDVQANIVDILCSTHNYFGDAVCRCYQALTGTALEAAATDPLRLGSVSREELGIGLRSIRPVYCRSMPNVSKAVRSRHFVFSRVAANQVLEVVRVLHDSMDLDQHLSQR